MEISVKGKQVEVGEALRGHVDDNLKANVKKYFDKAIDATVIFSRDGHSFSADISVHAGRGMVMQGGGKAADAYSAFDSALGRIGKQLRRYKRRLRNHHKSRDNDDTLPALQYILAPESEEEEVPEENQPAIIAEMPHQIATLTVSEAVMRMDLADAPVLMFRNGHHGGLNIVYKRNDGNVGWIDPSSEKQE